MTDLVELAKRVEAGEAGLPIHKEILAALGYTWRGMGYWYRGDSHQWKGLTGFTTSVDAAMTLVPEGWAVERLSIWPASPEEADNQTPAKASVDMVGTSIERYGRRRIWGHSGNDGRVSADAATPALALTAACLRALAQGEG